MSSPRSRWKRAKTSAWTSSKREPEMRFGVDVRDRGRDVVRAHVLPPLVVARGRTAEKAGRPRGARAHPWPRCARLAQRRPPGGRIHAHGHHRDVDAAPHEPHPSTPARAPAPGRRGARIARRQCKVGAMDAWRANLVTGPRTWRDRPRCRRIAVLGIKPESRPARLRTTCRSTCCGTGMTSSRCPCTTRTWSRFSGAGLSLPRRGPGTDRHGQRLPPAAGHPAPRSGHPGGEAEGRLAPARDRGTMRRPRPWPARASASSRTGASWWSTAASPDGDVHRRSTRADRPAGCRRTAGPAGRPVGGRSRRPRLPPALRLSLLPGARRAVARPRGGGPGGAASSVAAVGLG